MDLISAALLMLSILLSAGRNVLTKGISDAIFGKRNFFLLQMLIFLFGGMLLLMLEGWHGISRLTCGYAAIYGVMLIAAQWCYTMAMHRGNTAICATIYSMGFVFPTLSGALFWQESVTIWKILGILVVIPTVILSGKKAGHETKKQGNGSFIGLMLIAMMASGGLGIMQKIQQTSPYADERAAFIMVAFLISGTLSLGCALLSPRNEVGLSGKKMLCASGVGICFGTCNLLNTVLAGRLDSAVFFPMLNIGMILISLALSVVFFKEKLTRRHGLILLLGFAAILLINL